MLRTPFFKATLKNKYLWSKPWILVRLEQVGRMSTKEVALRPQASHHAWNSKITHQLHKMGFAASKSNSSLFTQKGPKGSVCILLYVDDLVVTGPDLAEISPVKS